MSDVKMVYPIVSSVNGTVVTGHTYTDGAVGLAMAINVRAGDLALVSVGKPLRWDGKGVFMVDGVAVAVNPTYRGSKDPNGDIALPVFVARARKKVTGGAATGAKTRAKATPAKVRATGKAATAATGPDKAPTARRATSRRAKVPASV